MKKGFTMIELIFVIVILGILSAIAVPKLSGISEDARATTAATNFTTLLTDLTTYYAQHQDLDETMSNMTRSNQYVKLANGTATVTALNQECITITAAKAGTGTAATLIASKGAGSAAPICQKIYEVDGVANALGLINADGKPKADLFKDPVYLIGEKAK
ncbi:type II secretion system protein [Campylobacter pinnipediorum]|uniref:type II secretion system protein n=1 Tax=Campylobacter pinnipediorum TaxID=1965231 RepID=UPI00084D2FC5|nr:type II secretion system protein [Campylobacter pinnipediorum]